MLLRQGWWYAWQRETETIAIPGAQQRNPWLDHLHLLLPEVQEMKKAAIWRAWPGRWTEAGLEKLRTTGSGHSSWQDPISRMFFFSWFRLWWLYLPA